MKNFKIFIGSFAVISAIILLYSCSKETSSGQNLSDRTVENRSVSEISINQNAFGPCGPAQLGIICNTSIVPFTEPITLDSTGCQFSVTMNVQECTSSGSAYFMFSLVDWSPINQGSSPCNTYWNWFINLPQADFDRVADSIENVLANSFISDFMHDQVLSNPLLSDCQFSHYYHSVFFRPLCTMRCEGVRGEGIFFTNVPCSTDGCCASTTHYCLQNGQVREFGPYLEKLSDCSINTNTQCPKKTQVASWCRTISCTQ